LAGHSGYLSAILAKAILLNSFEGQKSLADVLLAIA
jgi:hypothetical protein